MKTYSVSEAKKKNSIISEEDFNTEYQESINNPESFWQKKAEETLDWFSNWDEVTASYLEAGEVAWFKTGKLNAGFNCVDRHLETHANKTAIIWEGDDPNDNKEISFQELHKNVCQFANLLKSRNIKKGDRVCIYMPMIPEAAYAMLACARIGAVHSIIFGGLSPDSIATRITDCDSEYLITADEGVRGGKIIPLKKIADENDVGIVLITSSKAYSKRHSHLLTMVKNRCQASLLGKRRRIQGQNKMWLLHMPTKSSGYRKEITQQQTLYESISRIIDNRLRIESIEEIE